MRKSTPLWYMERQITTFENSLEGILSKRKHSRYRSGRSRHWLKVKNPNAPAVTGTPRRIGAVADRDPLSQVDRLIADCKKRIARQREVVASAFQEGGDTEVLVSMLRAFEASLRAFEKHRQLILDRQKKPGR